MFQFLSLFFFLSLYCDDVIHYYHAYDIDSEDEDALSPFTHRLSSMISQPNLPVLCVYYDPRSAALPATTPALMVIHPWRDARIGMRPPQLHSGWTWTSTSSIGSTFLSDVTSPDGEAAKALSRMRRPSARSSRGHAQDMTGSSVEHGKRLMWSLTLILMVSKKSTLDLYTLSLSSSMLSPTSFRSPPSSSLAGAQLAPTIRKRGQAPP